MASIIKTGASPGGPFRGFRIWLGLLVLAAGVVGLRWALREQLDPHEALRLLRSVQDHWWAKPVFVLGYVAATALFLPAVLFHLVSGATWGLGVGLGLNFLSVNASASLQFLFARWLGRARVARLFPGRRLEFFDGAARRHGFRAVVAVRMLPLPHMAVNVAAGVSAMRWRDFALGSLLGTVPVVLVYTTFAASLIDGAAGAPRTAALQTLLAGGVMVLLAFGPKAVLWLRRRRAIRPAARAG